MLGIEDLLKENKKLELKDIVKIHYRLMHEYPMPLVNIKNYEKCNPGFPVTIRMKGMPAPEVDIFKGKIMKSDRNTLDLPIYASFRTTTGTTLRPLKQIQKDQYTVLLPEKLTNGFVGIIFPIQENFGTKEVIDKLPTDIQNWIIRSKSFSRSILSNVDCRSLTTPLPDSRYLATIVPQPLRFNFSPTCDICPYEALKVTPTYCYIDPLICRGQKYSRLDGLQRGPEEICWNCFAGTETVSTKCEYVTIRKVLHLNPDAPKQEVPCCGGCEIPDLCPRGAIYKPPEFSFYAADKARCNGCMECYLNIFCLWNCGTNCNSECEHYDRDSSVSLYNGEGGYNYVDIHNNYTIRMVAHIDEKLKFIPVALKAFRIEKAHLIEDHLPWPRSWDPLFNYDDFESGSEASGFYNFDLIVWGDKLEKIPIKLDKTGVHEFKPKEIPFTKSMHLGLFERGGTLLGFSYCGSNMPIKSLGAKRYSDPTKLVDGGTFDFNSPIGTIQIEYMIK